MTERQQVDQQAREFFQDLWIRGDYWDFESSEYEKTRLAHLFKMLDGRRYPRVLEIGCGSGHFTRLLARIADQIVALDIAPAAIERARSLGIGPAKVDFRVHSEAGRRREAVLPEVRGARHPRTKDPANCIL